VVEHQDRLTCIGAYYIEQLMKMQGRRIERLFSTDTERDIVDDFIAVITSKANLGYEQQRSRAPAEKLKLCVEQVMKQDGGND
jgi:predicted site-specific integrase-resolvase